MVAWFPICFRLRYCNGDACEQDRWKKAIYLIATLIVARVESDRFPQVPLAARRIETGSVTVTHVSYLYVVS